MPAESNRVKKAVKHKKILKLDKVSSENTGSISKYVSDELIFALDIGTRTVVGIVGVTEKSKFKVLAAEVLEHKNRAMLDGQIHDINQVADAAKQVKELLEKKIGIPLTKVAIAAAGRVLKTCQVSIEREIDQSREIDQELVGSIEVEGIQLAQLKLDEDVSNEEKTQFYCVGYSVINYYLNGYVISSLIGHKGKKIGADVLATFLPHIVVDSLYTVMRKIGLEVVSLTLEPIAAINVTIPKDLRLLNLALVDIGAGTSDIAITKDGGVIAYAMAPIAGDEITEKIVQHYLVDFNTAEVIKTSLSSANESVKFVDILDKEHDVNISEIHEVIKPSIELLSATISQKILEYNTKAPNAVFLIGGGSQIPGLTDMIADCLKLPRERVVVKGRDVIPNIRFSGKKLSGPEAITPFGIAVTAQGQKGRDFLNVTINGKKIRLFNSKKLMVADALILIGFDPGQLIGRTGKSISFEINGVKKVVRGGFGKAAEIFVNGVSASLETFLVDGDVIDIIPAENGSDASAKISNFIQDLRIYKVILNGNPVDAGSMVYINGETADINYIIQENDSIIINRIITIGDLASTYEVDTQGFDVLVNGNLVETEYKLEENDFIELKPQKDKHDEIKDVLNNLENVNPLAVEADIGTHIIVNGNKTLLPAGKSHYIFVDVFNFINFDLSKPQGNIALKLNGENAAFTDEIKPGDRIDIYWEK